jgi:serine phosphatase RsbU (regulator of sigma subunit)
VLCKITDDGKYITCWIGVYDSRTHLMQSVNAGHPAPLLYNHTTKDMRQLSIGGTILGFFDDGYNFKVQEETLHPDDVILVYTDGVTEASNSFGELYEENERLLKFVKSSSKYEPSYLLMSLKADITRFTGSDHFDDDLTCMVIKKT